MQKVAVSNIAKQIRGVSYKPVDLHNDLNKDSVILLRANNISGGKINFDDVVYVDKKKVSSEQYLQKGDILICASSGSKNLVGKAASVSFDIKCTFGAFCKVIRPISKYANYLGMYFQSDIYRRIISNVAIGANINNIRNEHIDSLELSIYSDDKNNEIVSTLDTLQSIITHRRTQLEKLDLLVKARFVEMFGEVGTDKFGWGLQKIGDICEINPKKAKESKLHSELKISFVPMPAVSEYGNIDATEIKTYEEVKSGFTYFAENDVLFAKITPCMENGKGCIARGLCNGIGFGSTEFHVIRPTAKTNPYWIYNVTVFKQFRKDAAANMTGSAGQRRVPAKFLENYKVALPPIELQTQFADFVKQVDKSKATVQKALDEAQLLFDSLMQEYFG